MNTPFVQGRRRRAVIDVDSHRKDFQKRSLHSDGICRFGMKKRHSISMRFSPLPHSKHGHRVEKVHSRSLSPNASRGWKPSRAICLHAVATVREEGRRSSSKRETLSSVFPMFGYFFFGHFPENLARYTFVEICPLPFSGGFTVAGANADSVVAPLDSSDTQAAADRPTFRVESKMMSNSSKGYVHCSTARPGPSVSLIQSLASL